MVKIAPSILSANFANLAEDIKLLDVAGADMIHFDVMDGCFVPNISFGAGVIKSVRPLTNLIFDVHLMINEPHDKITWFSEAGADMERNKAAGHEPGSDTTDKSRAAVRGPA